jgi:hypothetical protein
VHQAGKPLLDKELNLSSDLRYKPTTPSGWVTDDGLSSSTCAPFLDLSQASNKVTFTPFKAVVNGWALDVLHTSVLNGNYLDLGAAPVGAGVKRTDLVVLEVWRRLVSPAPDATGKSPAGRIWLNGNVKLFDAGDPSLDLDNNLVDDLLDVNVGSETTKRVQIQYRLRVVHGVDVYAYPMALDDPNVLAHSVPVSASAPDGVVSAFSYIKSTTDDGLWLAGNGNPSNSLGTVDGFTYAIPLCIIFRRNSTAFARATNHNGAGISSGTSGRPDGLFHDLMVLEDFADMRRSVGFWNFDEALEKNVNAIFDNALCTEWGTTAHGGGCNGHTYLWADEIGLSNANGGDGVITGDTPGAEFVGEFDAVRREFSDRSVYEVATIRIPKTSGNWTIGGTVNIEPSALEVYPYAPFNWAAFAPSSVTFVDVLQARFVGYDVSHRGATASLSRVTNLGARPQGAITLTLGTIPAGVTNEDLLVDVLVLYPTGVGLAKTAVATFGSASLTYNNLSQLPATSPIRYDQTVFDLDSVHREASLRYTTLSFTLNLSAEPADGTVVHMPERVWELVSVTVNSVPATATVSTDGRTLTSLSPAATTGQVVAVTFKAVRPFPQNGEQVAIWYHARAPQTIRGANLPSPLRLFPRLFSNNLYAMSIGSGSPDEGYPFPMAYVQSGAIKVPTGGSFGGDYELDSKAHLSVANFDADTGLIRLGTFVGMVPNPQDFDFSRPGGVGEVDAEGRTYYSRPEGSYLPNAYAQDLSDPKRHKSILPVLCELREDSEFGRKGQLVLVLFNRWASFDRVNGVYFDEDINTNVTCASVYRLRGNLLSCGRSY